jgi:hypothetical protein
LYNVKACYKNFDLGKAITSTVYLMERSMKPTIWTDPKIMENYEKMRTRYLMRQGRALEVVLDMKSSHQKVLDWLKEYAFEPIERNPIEDEGFRYYKKTWLSTLLCPNKKPLQGRHAFRCPNEKVPLMIDLWCEIFERSTRRQIIRVGRQMGCHLGHPFNPNPLKHPFCKHCGLHEKYKNDECYFLLPHLDENPLVYIREYVYLDTEHREDEVPLNTCNYDQKHTHPGQKKMTYLGCQHPMDANYYAHSGKFKGIYKEPLTMRKCTYPLCR